MPDKPKTHRLTQANLLLLLPALFIIPAVLAFIHQDKVIFPGIGADRLEAYTDSIADSSATSHAARASKGTNSATDSGAANVARDRSYVKELTIGKDGINFTFHRNQKIDFSFAGFKIANPSKTRFIDVSPYDHLVVTIASGNSKGLQLILRTFVEGFTTMDNEDSYRPDVCDLFFLPGSHTYRVGLESFHTESYWYRQNTLTESRVGKIDFSRVLDMKIESEDASLQDEDEHVVIKSLKFEKDNSLLYGATLLFIVLYYLGFWSYQRISARMRTPLAIPYEKLNLINYNDEYLNKIMGFIAKHYSDGELTIGKISENTGISSAKIAQVIQLSHNLSYKQYLNTIRMAEAKRLLKETDRQISEIAFSVGYQSVTHFYKVFKQVFNQSPNVFRQNERERK